MPEHLFRLTGGTVGILRKLIQKACRRAIETGEEEITAGLLDSLTLTRKDLPGLDPDSGEIPDILAAPDAKKPAGFHNLVVAFDLRFHGRPLTVMLPVRPR